MERLKTGVALAFVVLAIAFAGVAQAQNAAQQIDQLKVSLQSNPEDIGTRLQLINLLFMNGDYREVIIFADKAIEMMPTRSSLYFYTGESYRKLGEFDSAYIFLKKGYETRQYTDLNESYGMILLRMRKTDEAAPILRTVAKEKTSFIDNHLAAGSQAYKNGNLEEATDEFLAVFTVDKTKLSQEQLTFMQFNLNFQSYIQNNNTDAAVGAFVTTLKARFGSDYEFGDIGEAFRCLVEQKKVDAARDLFEGFNKLPASEISQDLVDKKFFAISYDMMPQCGKLKDIAKSLFQKVSQDKFVLTSIDLAPLFSLYDFILTQGATQLASDLTNKVMDNSSPIKEPFLRLTMIFIQSNRIEDAMKTIRKYFVREKIDELGYTDDFVRSFQAALNQGNNDQVNGIFLQLNGMNTKDLSSIYVALGDIFTKLGNGEKAIAILNKVLSIDPGNHIASLKLGEAYYSTGRYDEIIKSLANTTDKVGLRISRAGLRKENNVA